MPAGCLLGPKTPHWDFGEDELAIDFDLSDLPMACPHVRRGYVIKSLEFVWPIFPGHFRHQHGARSVHC